MALPPGIKTVTVEIGPYVSLTTGQPIRGKITFRPSRWLIWQATGTPLVQMDRVVDLDEAGMATVVLPATDQAGFVDSTQAPVARWTYRVTTSLTGVQQNPPDADIALLEGAPTVDLDLLVPVPASTGVVVTRPEVLSVAGLTGVITASALAARLPTSSGGTGGTGVDAETVRDTIAAALRGTGLTVAHDDNADTITLTPDVRSVAGRTGAVILNRSDVGLSQVDNTPDTGKPLSTAATSALAGKVNTADLTELVQDIAAALITGATHTGISWTYDDTAGRLAATVTATGSGASTDPEVVRDTIAAALRGTGVTVVHDDAADTITLTAAVTSVAGKTGAVVLDKADVGLSNVNNTADANKPVSSATQTALDAKAPLTSPAFTGTPTGITKAHVGLGSVDNTTDAGKPVSTAQAAADAVVRAAAVQRANHTGTQPQASVDGLTTALAGKAPLSQAIYRVDPATYDDSDLAAALASVPSTWGGLVAVKVAGS